MPPSESDRTLLGTEATAAGLVDVLHDLHGALAPTQETPVAPEWPEANETSTAGEALGGPPDGSSLTPSQASTRFYVVATGGAWADRPVAPGEDRQRIAYLHEHLDQAAEARQQGLPLTGLFYEPLLDGFQWQHGLHARSGLVRVDFETGARHPRDSFAWWARWLRDR